MEINTLYSQNKVPYIKGRYVTLSDLEPFLKTLSKGELKVIGQSVEQRPIYQYTIGTGAVKILMWSQMHGNESTTTKAVVDLLNLLQTENELAKTILAEYTLCILPMLNPDGAFLYTRANSVSVDLNRDSQELTQPESQVLKMTYTAFKPDFGFNLHDQRTIFGAGQTNNPATVSFLSPSYNESREINTVRKKAMSVIVAMNNELQKHIPNQVGRFDDGFNLNCIGDTMQYNGIPTILFESGHFPGDYEREETRKYIFIALLTALKNITKINYEIDSVSEYLKIPQNSTDFYDVIVRNVSVVADKIKKNTTFGLLYKEVLVNSKIEFHSYISAIDDLTEKFGHLEYDAEGKEFKGTPEIGQPSDFVIGDLHFNNGIILQKTN